MNEPQVQQLKSLKRKFRDLPPKERENLGICFLKVKLGVHNPQEFNAVMNFLSTFKAEISPENLDHLMNFLHAQDHSLPEFIAMEDSLRGGQSYNPDDVETLKEGRKPFVGR